MFPFIRAGVAAALLLGAPPTFAGDIRVTHTRCSAQVHVVARDAPLSAVLKKLADVLDFQLRFDSDSDPLVTVDVTQRWNELPARLAPSENVSMMLERDPRCSGQQRIVKVWVLPSGSLHGVRPLPTAANPQAAEQARLVQEGGEVILRSHGFDANGAPLVH